MIERLLIGRLFTWLLQTNGLMEPIWNRHYLLKDLSECDLCLGFWVYLAVFLLPRQRLMTEWPKIAEDVATAGIAAFLAHLIRMGWQSKFGNVTFN